MKIALASDHGGFELKESIKAHLEERGIETKDLGCNSTDPVDYPDYGALCAKTVASHVCDLGIVVCGTGIGISIAANKVKGIRCAVVVTEYMAEMAKKHNNANMIALGGRIISPEEANTFIDLWLDTEAETAERHVRRVAKLNQM